jgi:hypothetical protein
MNMSYNLRETIDRVGDSYYYCDIVRGNDVFSGESGHEETAIKLAEQNLNEFLSETLPNPTQPNWENSIESFLCRN